MNGGSQLIDREEVTIIADIRHELEAIHRLFEEEDDGEEAEKTTPEALAAERELCPTGSR